MQLEALIHGGHCDQRVDVSTALSHNSHSEQHAFEGSCVMCK